MACPARSFSIAIIELAACAELAVKGCRLRVCVYPIAGFYYTNLQHLVVPLHLTDNICVRLLPPVALPLIPYVIGHESGASCRRGGETVRLTGRQWCCVLRRRRPVRRPVEMTDAWLTVRYRSIPLFLTRRERPRRSAYICIMSFWCGLFTGAAAGHVRAAAIN